MKTVIGVRFRTAGKIYYFSQGEFAIRRGDRVIVETARGVEFGRVVGDPMEIDDKKVQQPLRPVLRMATPEDKEHEQANREREREAFKICHERIRRHGLEMKLIDAEYTFDNSKILFYFTADGRVDFRELVKDLAGVFRTRIELRQIGVRDETKILGGFGICGRPLCCHSYLSDFIPVSIKMAKEQNLSLNPTKISGVCGRLMCCLKNEEETYEELNRRLPGVGDEVQGDDGLQGEVESVNVLRQTVRILVEVDDEKELHEYGVDQITLLRKRRRGSARPSLRRDNPAAAKGRQGQSGKDGQLDRGVRGGQGPARSGGRPYRSQEGAGRPERYGQRSGDGLRPEQYGQRPADGQSGDGFRPQEGAGRSERYSQRFTDGQTGDVSRSQDGAGRSERYGQRAEQYNQRSADGQNGDTSRPPYGAGRPERYNQRPGRYGRRDRGEQRPEQK